MNDLPAWMKADLEDAFNDPDSDPNNWDGELPSLQDQNPELYGYITNSNPHGQEGGY